MCDSFVSLVFCNSADRFAKTSLSKLDSEESSGLFQLMKEVPYCPQTISLINLYYFYDDI